MKVEIGKSYMVNTGWDGCFVIKVLDIIDNKVKCRYPSGLEVFVELDKFEYCVDFEVKFK